MSRTVSVDRRRIPLTANVLANQGDVDRHNHRDENDYYTQRGNLFRLMPKDAMERLISRAAKISL